MRMPVKYPNVRMRGKILSRNVGKLRNSYIVCIYANTIRNVGAIVAPLR